MTSEPTGPETGPHHPPRRRGAAAPYLPGRRPGETRNDIRPDGTGDRAAPSAATARGHRPPAGELPDRPRRRRARRPDALADLDRHGLDRRLGPALRPGRLP